MQIKAVRFILYIEYPAFTTDLFSLTIFNFFYMLLKFDYTIVLFLSNVYDIMIKDRKSNTSNLRDYLILLKTKF